MQNYKKEANRKKQEIPQYKFKHDENCTIWTKGEKDTERRCVLQKVTNACIVSGEGFLVTSCEQYACDIMWF